MYTINCKELGCVKNDSSNSLATSKSCDCQKWFFFFYMLDHKIVTFIMSYKKTKRKVSATTYQNHFLEQCCKFCWLKGKIL